MYTTVIVAVLPSGGTCYYTVRAMCYSSRTALITSTTALPFRSSAVYYAHSDACVYTRTTCRRDDMRGACNAPHYLVVRRRVAPSSILGSACPNSTSVSSITACPARRQDCCYCCALHATMSAVLLAYVLLDEHTIKHTHTHVGRTRIV